MKRSFVFFSLLCLVQSSVFGNLLINGDAESSNFTGWTLSGDNILQWVTTRKQATGWVYPAEGDHFFSFARIQGSYAMMSQTGLIDNTVESLTLGGFFHRGHRDLGRIQKSGGGGVYLNQNAVMGVITADLTFLVIFPLFFLTIRRKGV